MSLELKRSHIDERITFRLSAKEAEALRAASSQRNTPLSQVIRDYLFNEAFKGEDRERYQRPKISHS
jgi:hypothetical protein